MKVFELIEQLKQFPQDSWVLATEEGNPYTIRKLEEWKTEGRHFSADLTEKLVDTVLLVG